MLFLSRIVRLGFLYMRFVFLYVLLIVVRLIKYPFNKMTLFIKAFIIIIVGILRRKSEALFKLHNNYVLAFAIFEIVNY